MLDVPVHKTGTALTKPIDAIVGEAVIAWEKVRPVQPRLEDIKTAESVDFLFSFRARQLPVTPSSTGGTRAGSSPGPGGCWLARRRIWAALGWARRKMVGEELSNRGKIWSLRG
jgi:hypothetical protein